MRDKFIRASAAISLITASVLWGATLVFAKVALTQLSVFHLLLYRFGLASCVLLPLLLLYRRRLDPKDAGVLLLIGFLTVPATYFLQFTGLAHTSASGAALIIGLFPPVLALASTWLYRERLPWMGWGAIAMSVLGVVISVGVPGDEQSLLGNTVTTYVLIFGTLTLLPISLLLDGLPSLSLSAEVWLSLLALGPICTVLPYMLWNWGLNYIPTSQAGVYTNLQTVVGAMLGVLVLHETLGAGILLGGATIVGAAVVISMPSLDRQVD
jgi:drug/metabolite transporter (DMT)-like permease